MATASPLFSIIVPTFNVAATLSACLGSIAGQSFDDYEVILIDGGSSDGTLEIANSRLPSFGDRLVVHSGRDQGPYDAMNKGVGLASGSWLIFLGADDTLYQTETLAEVAAFIGEHEPSDLVYGDVILRSDSARYAGEFDLDRLLFDVNICHQSIFYRRELFAGIGPYNLRYKLWADWDFNVRCFSNPALVTRYMDLVVADYNDMSGLSSKQDDEFKKRLPRFIVASGVEMIRRRLPVRKSRLSLA